MSDVILTLLVVAPTIAFGMWWVTRPAKALPARSDPNLDLAVLLFRNNVLEHATALALQRFPVVVGAQEWADLVEILQPDYPVLRLPARGTQNYLHDKCDRKPEPCHPKNYQNARQLPDR